MKRLLVLAFLVGLNPSASFADTLRISGAFGNEEGCKAVVDNAAMRSESLLILRSDSIERYESHCGILEVQSSAGGWAVVDAICGGEGETWTETFLFREDADDRSKATLTVGASGEPDALKRCDQ